MGATVILDLPDLDGANCAYIGDPEMFFPSSERRQGHDAKKVCRPCPVRDACLAFAMSHPMDGVWGGTTVEERKILAAKMGRGYTPGAVGESPCGTREAQRRHRRAGESCPVCRVRRAA